MILNRLNNPGGVAGFVAVLLLAACSGTELPVLHDGSGGHVEPVTLGQPVHAEMTDLILALPANRRIGDYALHIDCAGPYSNLFPNDLQSSHRSYWWQLGAQSALQQAGFDVDQLPVGIPDERRIDIRGRVTDLRLAMCRKTSFLTGDRQGESGDGYIRVDWRAYDGSGRLILTGETEAIDRLDEPAWQGRKVLAATVLAKALGIFTRDLRQHLDGPQTTAANVEETPVTAMAAPVLAVQATVVSTAAPAFPATASLLPVFDRPSPLQGRLDRHAGRLLASMIRVDTSAGPVPGVVVGLKDEDMLALVPMAPMAARDDAAILRITDTDGERYSGAWYQPHHETPYRLVLIRGGERILPALPMADRAPIVGDMLYAVTSPAQRGFEPAVSRGVVSGTCGNADGLAGRQLMEADLPVARRIMLGQDPLQLGGLLVDASGNVLGLAVPGENGNHTGLVCFAPINGLIGDAVADRP